MLESLETRGPDGSGVYEDEHVKLGHRRLAIIDIVGGTQPMSTSDGRYTIVYNGEVYNFPTLRKDLKSAGREFRTQSDTEVVLQAFAQWRLECLPRLDGMFAFAVWDSRERQLWIARDRLGIKPLFVCQQQESVIFASTLAPFFQMSSFRRRINYQALRDYLAQLFIGPADSILEGVEQLPPGTWLSWQADSKKVSRGRYWDIPRPTEKPMCFEELLEATDAALQENVTRQLVSDRPLGVLFSGGIDSSLLTHYMIQANGANRVKTFTVKFDQSDRHDEAPIASRVAKEMGTEHHEHQASHISEDDFRNCLADMDQPFGDSSYLPVLKLAQMAREQITVAIGGDGGDELFGGYPRYFKEEHHYQSNAIMRTMRKAIEHRLLPMSLYRVCLRGKDRVIRHFSRMGNYPVTPRSIQSIVAEEVLAEIAIEHTMADWLALVARWSDQMNTDSLMRSDVWYYLACNGLVKTDRATMAASIEARVPFLGNPLIDLVMPQPAAVRLQHGPKGVLKALAQRHLPDEVWNRPKRGFTVPETDYLTRRWRPYCDHLMADCDRLAPFLNADEIRQRWQGLLRGRRIDWPIYGIIVLLGWLETHPVEY